MAGGAPPVFPVGLTHGPALVAATRYTDSPVGVFVELIIGHPARLGLRFGWMISESSLAATAEDAWIGGRSSRGFPLRATCRSPVGGRRPRACTWMAISRVSIRRAEGHAAAVARTGASTATPERRLHDRSRPSAAGGSPAPSRRSQTTRRDRRGRIPARWCPDYGATRICAGAAGPAQVARRPSEGARACGMV